MNNKCTSQDIADVLTQKHGMSQKDATTFVKELFLLAEQALETDKIVKLKGFGTFKIVKVKLRESVSVNTGEPCIIPGHSKITFTPDVSLATTLNRPFAHFEPVIIEKGTDLEDAPVRYAAAESTQEPPLKTELPPTEEELPEPAEVPAEESTFSSEQPPLNKYVYVIVGAVLIACAGILYYLFSDPGEEENFISEDDLEQIEEPISPRIAAADTVAVGSAKFVPKAKPVARKAVKKKSVPTKNASGSSWKRTAEDLRIMRDKSPVTPDSVNYLITGTKTKYKVKPGETLTRVSLRFYNTKDLWPYVLKHNRRRIQNPPIIQAGMMLDIPELKKKKAGHS